MCRHVREFFCLCRSRENFSFWAICGLFYMRLASYFVCKKLATWSSNKKAISMTRFYLLVASGKMLTAFVPECSKLKTSRDGSYLVCSSKGLHCTKLASDFSKTWEISKPISFLAFWKLCMQFGTPFAKQSRFYTIKWIFCFTFVKIAHEFVLIRYLALTCCLVRSYAVLIYKKNFFLVKVVFTREIWILMNWDLFVLQNQTKSWTNLFRH